MADEKNWLIQEDRLDRSNLNHKETIFTIGNGYLSTRGVYEEGYPNEARATFVHGVFDDIPILFTELVNMPDWLPLSIYLDGERFSMDKGEILEYRRSLNLSCGVLNRLVRWRSPGGREAIIEYERFASLARPHLLLIRCKVTPKFSGKVEIRLSINGNVSNEGMTHWLWLEQGRQGEITYLINRTRATRIEAATAMSVKVSQGAPKSREYWDADNTPTEVLGFNAEAGQTLVVDKLVSVYTSREAPTPLRAAVQELQACRGWEAEQEDHRRAWAEEWDRTDVIIEGDDEAQIAVRFNLYHLLIAAPRQDEQVNIGAKTLSGFGYRGHCFWDTETFILPLFIYTAPSIARNLLNYRYHRLPAARARAREDGYEGARFPWESADSGSEVTPRWVPSPDHPASLIRIWTGDIEIHISADIAYAAHLYWKVTGDDAWLVERGAEIILDTARFWASRAEWDETSASYQYNDVIGPDEYHEHVNNNAFTNRMAQWNLQTAFQVLEWLEKNAPEKAKELKEALNLSPQRLGKWRHVIENLYLPVGENGLIEQFSGYFQRVDLRLESLEPRDRSAQALLGIEGTNKTQVIKQPDVLMLFHLLRQDYSKEVIAVNYDYYSPRTDHTFGSSLGPAIHAIIACEIGRIDDAYIHFMRAAQADLRNVRGNAGDGIHAASAGGTWQAVVFGFAGLRVSENGWKIHPRLPAHWKRLAFKFFYRGQRQEVEIRNE